MIATSEGVSLNQWLVSVISQGVTFAVAATSLGARVPMYVGSAGSNVQVHGPSGHISLSTGSTMLFGSDGVSVSGAGYMIAPNEFAFAFRSGLTAKTAARRKAEEPKGTARASRKAT
jgi:hypothetical protein